MLRLTRSRFLVKIDSCRATSAFYSGCSPRTKATIQQHCRLWPNFIEPAVEGLFLQEIEPQIRHLPYNDSHFDNAIHNFREIQKSSWTGHWTTQLPASHGRPNNILFAYQSCQMQVKSRVKLTYFIFTTNFPNKGRIFDKPVEPYFQCPFEDSTLEEILNKVTRTCFEESDQIKLHTHCLDLAEHGEILPHVDSVKFVGRGLATISLLSDSILRFRRVEDPDDFVDILVPRYSLYCMADEARYGFTHEILKSGSSFFNGAKIDKSRRISIIQRIEPETKGGSLFENHGTLDIEEDFEEDDEPRFPELPPLR